MFARRPWQRDLPTRYPPITQYNTILLRLRRLGLYSEDHLVGKGNNYMYACDDSSGCFTVILQDFNEMMADTRRSRGKGTPRKGIDVVIICSVRYDGNGILLM